ncbi:hypothetical protein OK074_5684 [Actinobacteria bacterium OK074]|nr:hypothetical protein OK074_5684 [Actinobacteria bacterium OK074]
MRVVVTMAQLFPSSASGTSSVSGTDAVAGSGSGPGDNTSPGVGMRPRPPGAGTPPTCPVPHFAPVRVRGGQYRLRRLVRHRRRALALGLAVTAAALVAAGPQTAGRARGHPDAAPAARAEPEGAAGRSPGRHPVELVTAPVRIADAATVRLLRRGDRVDVIAAGSGGEARVVASGARVTDVPVDGDGEGAGGSVGAGALLVLSVPRATAAELVGAGANSRLAVTLC